MIPFKIRSSACGNIMAPIGLTDKQETELARLINLKKEKGKITPNQEKTVADYTAKKNNPELPQGAKTYCENWVKSQLYQKRKIVSSKYLSKGLIQEDGAIDLASDYFGWGLVQKNEQFFENSHSTGS